MQAEYLMPVEAPIRGEAVFDLLEDPHAASTSVHPSPVMVMRQRRRMGQL
jgi:hypothetical protein